MDYRCQINDPQQAAQRQEDGKDRVSLVIRVKDHDLKSCEVLWVKTFRVWRGSELLIPISEFITTKANSLTFPRYSGRILHPELESPLTTDVNTVWFGLRIDDIESIAKNANKNLSDIEFLILPCNALKDAGIPGFEDGCT